MFNSFVFDMDGILFDTQTIYNKSYTAAGHVYGIEPIDEIVIKTMGCNLETTEKIYKSYMGEEFDFEDFNRLAVKEYHNIIKREGLPVKEGVYPLLAYLKTNRCRVALASSTYKQMVMDQLKEAHIDEYFQIIVTGDMVKKGKPDPEIYEVACRLLNVRPEETIAFEDSPNGIKSACGAGLKTIMIPDRIPYSEEIRPYLYEKFNSLHDVLKALQKNNL